MKKSLFSAASGHAALAALGCIMSPSERRLGRFLRAPEGHQQQEPKQKSVEEISTDLLAKVKTATDEAKSVAEKAVADVTQFGSLSTEAKEKADEALSKMNGLSEQLKEFGQVVDRLKLGGATGQEIKSLGNQFVESESFKALATNEQSGQRGRASLEVKATITSLTTNANGSAGAAIEPTRLAGILQIAQRRLVVRDLLSQGQMGGNSLQYVRQTGFTNAAAMVAEGTRKPQSDIKLALVDTTAKVIAHFMKASRQVLDDAPQLRSLIDGHLIYGLEFREEAQILYGDGTGQNLLGIVPQATDYDDQYEAALVDTAGAARDATALDRIRLAMLQAVLAEYPATGIVLNPIDWARIELLTDTLGRFVIGQPQGDAPLRLWRLPVVETPAMTAGTFLTGAFRLGAQIFDRWAARVQLATENEDDFVNNLVTILAEERLALAVFRPEAFITGDVWPVNA